MVRWGLQSKGLVSPWREGSLAPKLLTEQQLTSISQTLLLSKTYLGSSPSPHSAAHPPHPPPNSSFRKSVCVLGVAEVLGVLPAL